MSFQEAEKQRKTWGTLLVQTVGIDAMWWKMSKGAVSSSWSTANTGMLIRIWQMKISQWKFQGLLESQRTRTKQTPRRLKRLWQK